MAPTPKTSALGPRHRESPTNVLIHPKIVLFIFLVSAIGVGVYFIVRRLNAPSPPASAATPGTPSPSPPPPPTPSPTNGNTPPPTPGDGDGDSGSGGGGDSSSSGNATKEEEGADLGVVLASVFGSLLFLVLIYQAYKIVRKSTANSIRDYHDDDASTAAVPSPDSLQRIARVATGRGQQVLVEMTKEEQEAAAKYWPASNRNSKTRGRGGSVDDITEGLSQMSLGK